MLLVLARLTPAGAAPEDLSRSAAIHISLATIGVGVFALASALSAIYLAEDRALKKKKFDGVAFKDGGAPIEALDRLLAPADLGRVSDLHASRSCSARSGCRRLGESLDRIEYPLAAVTWVAFATLLVARQIYGWRGRRAARLTLAGFARALAGAGHLPHPADACG